MKQKGHSPKKAAQKNRIHSLAELLDTCKGIRNYRWLKVVAAKEGILTHELSDVMGLKSNNHHNVSKHLNKIIEPYGWCIEKRIITKQTESWGWYLVKVEQEGEK